MAAIEEKRQERVVFFIKRGIYTAYQELEPNWN
jgi:hypothetical protein